MKKYLFIIFLILCAGQIEAYNYGFTNNADRTVRACVNVTGSSGCINIRPNSWNEIRFADPAPIWRATVSWPDGSMGDETRNFNNFKGLGLGEAGDITFTINPLSNNRLHIKRNK